MKRHQEWSDVEVDAATVEELRVAYKTLRDHHVAETTVLVHDRDNYRDTAERRMCTIEYMQPIYEAAIEWYRHVNIVPATQWTARLIAAIDEAVESANVKKQP